MINPEIALSVKPVENQTPQLINILQQGRQRAIQMQQLQMERETHAQQLQIGQQHIQEGQTAVQRAQVAARDQQLGQQGAIAAGGDHAATLKFLRENNASPEYQMAYEKHVADLDQTNAKTASEQLPVKKDIEDRSAQVLSTAADALKNSPETFPEVWNSQLRPAYEAVNPKAKDLPVGQVPTELDINGALARHATQSFSLAKVKEQREAASEARAVTEFGQKQESENRIKDASMLANAMRQGPQAFAEALTTLPPERSAAFSSLTAASKPEDILRLGQSPNEQITTGLTASAQAQTASHNKAVEATERGNLAVRQGEAALAAKKFEAEYGANAPDAVKGMAPADRRKAQAQADKVDADYLKHQELARNLQTAIDASKTGNLTAGGQISKLATGEQNALMGIRRMSPADVAAIPGAAPLLSRISGQIDAAMEGGAKMTPGMIKDVEDFGKIVQGNMDSAHIEALKAVDSNHGSHFANVAIKKAAAAPAPAPAVEHHVIQLNGKNYKYKGTGKTSDIANYDEVKP